MLSAGGNELLLVQGPFPAISQRMKLRVRFPGSAWGPTHSQLLSSLASPPSPPLLFQEPRD